MFLPYDEKRLIADVGVKFLTMPGPASIWMPENIAKFEPNNDAKTENVYCQLRKVLPVRLKRQKNRMLHTANSANQEVVNEGASTTCEKKIDL